MPLMRPEHCCSTSISKSGTTNSSKSSEFPADILPEVGDSSEVYGYSKIVQGVPIARDLGDQQASLVGQLGIKKGDVVATYRTGGFIKMNLRETPKEAEGLALTIAYRI